MIQILKKLNGVEHIPPMQEKIAELEGVDFIGKQEVAKAVNLLSQSDQQFEEWIEQYRQLRQLLKSMTMRVPEISARTATVKKTSVRSS
jgi:hypothetical protein